MLKARLLNLPFFLRFALNRTIPRHNKQWPAMLIFSWYAQNFNYANMIIIKAFPTVKLK